MNSSPLTSCPDDETLASFLEGALDGPTAEQLGRHSETCESCHDALVALSRLRSTRGSGEPVNDAPDDSVREGTTLGRYVVKTRLGAGAMGVVFEAYDPALKRRVAVKLLRGATTARLQRRLEKEAQTMAQVSHRNVATVFDVGTFHGRSWIAMELVDGVTLRQWLKSDVRSRDAVLAVLLQAGEGLAAAHAQGVVHRDFKPDNILVEREGRAVVTDFGLSKASADEDGDEGESASVAVTASQSRLGHLFGTPAYMAPELFARGEATAWSDQYAFSVTAVEALTGRRPFDAETIEGLVKQLTTQQWTTGTRDDLPASLRPSLERALEVDPRARFPSMAELLSPLRPRSSEGRRWLVVAAALGLAVASVGAWTWNRSHLCSGAEATVAEVWNPQVAHRLHDRYVTVASAAASDSEPAMQRALEAWSARWATLFRESCEATRLRGEQSTEVLELETECLHQRLSEVRHLTTLWGEGEAAMLEQAPRALDRLPSIETCADVASLKAPIRSPDPRVRAQVAEARETFAGLMAKRAAGEWSALKAPTEALATRAAALGDAPFEAEVLLLQSELLDQLGEAAPAAKAGKAAVVAAERGGHVFIAAQAWALLVRVLGHALARYADGHDAADLARAMSARIGSPWHLEYVIARNEVEVLEDEGKHAEGEAKLREALALARRSAPDGLEVPAILNALGSQRLAQSDLPGALALFDEALALLAKRLSPQHPDLAEVMLNIGNAYWNQSKVDEAFEWYQKAHALLLAAYGPNSIKVSDTRNNLGAAYLRQQKLAEAEREFQEVLRIRTSALSATHPSLFSVLNNLAVVYRYTERSDEAVAALKRALDISIAAHGEFHGDVATTLINLGDAYLVKKQFAESIEVYRRAIAVTVKTVGEASPDLGDCYVGLSFPLMASNDAKGALEATEHAQAIFAKAPGMPYVEALGHFVHAQAQWELSPGSRAKAVAEARASRETLEKSGAQEADLADIDRWLAAHR